MAYEIHTLIDANGAPTDGKTKFDNWYANHNFVQTDREQRYTINAPREDGTLQGYDEFRVYLGLNEDLQATLSDLKEQFPDASWLVTHVRRDDREVPESDHDYCDPDLTDGLCAKVEATFDGHTLNHNEIHAIVGGTHQSVPSGEYEFDKPQGKEEVTLYIDDSGLNETSGVKVADIEVHPGRIVQIDEAEQPVVIDDTWGTPEIVRGSPPSYFEDKSESFPDPLPVDNFNRNEVTQTEIDAVYTLINNHPDKQTRDLASSIMDILF